MITVMDRKEMQDNISKMNNASLKQRQVELEYRYNGLKGEIERLMTEMQGCHDEYVMIGNELVKRNFR